MGKSFFTLIADLINGNKTEEAGDVANVGTTAPNNAIDKKSALLEAVISTLKSNYAGVKVSMADKSLVLWVNDSLFYDSLMLGDFKQQMITTVVDELGLEFGELVIRSPKPADNSSAEVMPGCYLQIEGFQKKQMVSRGVIYSVPGYGSIIGDCVNLDSQEIHRLPASRYNIGVGVQPRMSDGSHRVNQIAVNDDPASPDYEKNKYVSRAHANIIYNDKYGFMLCVEMGGSRVAQKRTHIYRNGRQIELNNTLVPEQLYDDDYIVLSKHVHLLFKKV